MRARFHDRAPRSETVHHLLGNPGAEEPFEDFLPLQGPAHEKQLLCSEEAGPVFIHTDRLGFNNSTDDRYEDFEVVVTGDSFVHGWCVPAADHFVARLGRRVLNLGVTGSGPLTQLGTLIESGVFARAGEGRTIFWTVLLNDVLYDIERELGDTRLRGYFRGDSQGLAARTEDIARGWKKYRADETPTESAGWRLPDFLLVTYLRWFRAPPTRAADREYELRAADLTTFEKILARARSEAVARGYRFRVVFIPESGIFFDSKRAEQARSIVGVLGADVIDMTKVIVAAGGKPQDFYAAMPGYYGHFNGAGFALLARALQESLEQSTATNGRVVHHSGGARVRFTKEER